MKTYKLKDIISQGTKDLFYIWWQELKAVVKDQGVLIFFIPVPLGYPLSIPLYIPMKQYVKSLLL